jgi:hypothetical protein
VEPIDVAIWAVTVPLVMGVVQVCKQAGLPSRWAGMSAVALGMAGGVLVRLAGIGGGPLGLATLTGAIAGLSAAGAWSGVRAAGRG